MVANEFLPIHYYVKYVEIDFRVSATVFLLSTVQPFAQTCLWLHIDVQ